MTRDALPSIQDEVSVDAEDRLPPERLGTRTDIKGTSHCVAENVQRETTHESDRRRGTYGG